jgi:hypothetical protein
MVMNDKTALLTEYNDYCIVFGKEEIYFNTFTNKLSTNIGHNYK